MARDIKEIESELRESEDAQDAAVKVGGTVYQDAAKRVMRLRAELRDAKAEVMPVVYVVGDTYPHRRELKDLGLRWDRAHRAWVGRVDPADLPTGCRVASQGELALESMDREGSVY